MLLNNRKQNSQNFVLIFQYTILVFHEVSSNTAYTTPFSFRRKTAIIGKITIKIKNCIIYVRITNFIPAKAVYAVIIINDKHMANIDL